MAFPGANANAFLRYGRLAAKNPTRAAAVISNYGRAYTTFAVDEYGNPTDNINKPLPDPIPLKIEFPTSKTLDGESLVPLLRQSGGLKREAIFWHFPGYLDGPVPRGRDPVFRTRPVTTMNKGGYKLHLYHEEWLLDGGRERLPANRTVELYDLRRDVGEQHDLAASDPARRDALLGELLAWLRATQAKLATDRK